MAIKLNHPVSGIMKRGECIILGDNLELTENVDGIPVINVDVTGAGANSLDDLSDVILTTPASGDILYFNGSEWVNDNTIVSDLIIDSLSASPLTLRRSNVSLTRLLTLKNTDVTNGNGISVTVLADTDTTPNTDYGSLRFIIDDHINSTATSSFNLQTRVAGTLDNRLRVDPLGAVLIGDTDTGGTALMRVLNRLTVGLGGSAQTAYTPVLELTHTSPNLMFHESDAATDEGVWDIAAISGQLLMRARGDSATITSFMIIDRTGTTVDSVSLPNGSVIIGTDPGSTGLLRVGGSIRVGNTSSQPSIFISHTVNSATGLTLVQSETGSNAPRIFFQNTGNSVASAITMDPTATGWYHSFNIDSVPGSSTGTLVGGVRGTGGTALDGMLEWRRVVRMMSNQTQEYGNYDADTVYDMPGSASALRLNIQDGGGRANWYWGASAHDGVQLSSDIAWRWRVNSTGFDWYRANTNVGTGVAIDGWTTLLHADLNGVQVGTLGAFAVTPPTVPVSDDFLRFDGSQWIPASLQFSFTSGDVSAQILGDGTSAQLVNTVTTPSGTPVAPTLAPVVTPMYKSMLIDMSNYGILPANQQFVVEYSVNGGAFATNAIVGTGDKVIHSGLTLGDNYNYRFKVRGATDSAVSPESGDQMPSETTEISAFAIVMASQIVAQNLSVISENVGELTAGIIRNAANTAGIRLSGTLPAWTQYLDLAATGTEPFLLHPKLELNVDGSSIFRGPADITDGELVGGAFGDKHIFIRGPSVNHGMTDIVETDVTGAIGFGLSSGAVQSLGIVGFTGNNVGTYLAGVATSPNTGATGPATVIFQAWKKSGTTRDVLANGERAFVFNNGTNNILSLKAEKTAIFHGQMYSPRLDKGNVSGSVTIDWNDGNHQRIRLTGNITSLTLNNGNDGGVYILEVNRSGNFSITLPGIISWGDAGTPIQSTAANEVDIFTLLKVPVLGSGVTWYGSTMGTGFTGI